MSRLAKKPLVIPAGITVTKNNTELLIKGARGEKKVKILPGTEVTVTPETIAVGSLNSVKQSRANQGTLVSLTKNAIEGVSSGFTKVLEIEGVGYRALIEGKTLVLYLGFVMPVRYEPASGITLTVEKNAIKIEGIDKEVVGQTAAQIRAFKKPEPYKGKGIRYRGEVIRMKVGKKATATG